MKSFQFSDDFKDDVKNIAKLAAPVFLANVCNIGTAVSDNMFLVIRLEIFDNRLGTSWIRSVCRYGIEYLVLIYSCCYFHCIYRCHNLDRHRSRLWYGYSC